jgi:hypothetical protein
MMLKGMNEKNDAEQDHAFPSETVTSPRSRYLHAKVSLWLYLKAPSAAHDCRNLSGLPGYEDVCFSALLMVVIRVAIAFSSLERSCRGAI